MKILIKNAQIIKSENENAITGSIAIDGDTIKHVGNVPEDFKGDTVIDGGNYIAMPGLINAHTHSPMGILRNLADDLPFSDWLFNKIIPTEAKLSEDDIYWGSMLGIMEMIQSGTTCFADMYLHMDSVAAAVVESKIRANLSYGPITSNLRVGGHTVNKGKCRSFVNKWNNSENGRIKTFVEIHSMYLFDRMSIIAAADLAKDIGIGIHIHLSESVTELSDNGEKYGMSPIEAAQAFGVFNVPVIAAHCVKLSGEDIAILNRNNVTPVHNPSSNLKLGNGVAPCVRMIKEGLNVALGTDGAASNNNLNMLEEMHLTALIHKGITTNTECMPASKVIAMATENGARALGFDNLGTITEGSKADIVLVDINKPHMCPVNDPKAAMVYSAQAADVDTVIVDGNILMRNRKLQFVDEELIMSKVKNISERIKS